MRLKRTFRTFIMIMLTGVLLLGLTSCKLPASKGPESATATSEGFPVPGETQQTSGEIDANTIATQTAQANPAGVNPSQVPPVQPQVTSQTTPYPIATNVPGAPTPTSTPITYVQPTPGGPPSTYTLAEGEFLFCIARRFDLNQAELLNLNGLTAQSIVYAGQVLQIPQTGNPFDGTRALLDHPTTYEVQSDDTLNTIACSFGDISPDMIALQNNLSSDELSVGQVLVIP
jgi:LysM repeat protein